MITTLGTLLRPAFFAVLLFAPTWANAQAPQRTATTVGVTPVFASKDASQTPLRVASAGSVLLLLESAADWCLIEYQDPALGRRTGYVETKNVRLGSAAPADAAPSSTPRGTQSLRQVQGAPAEVKSHAEGFFLGGGLEGNAIVSTEGGFSSDTVSGPGFGIVLGYGFNPRWSLYGNLSAASLDDGGDSWGLGHFDVGTRIHFLAGPHRVVPFVQVGLGGRALAADVVTGARTVSVSAAGAGVAFGGGLNAHFAPKVAFSAAVTWSVGNFTKYKINDVDVPGSAYSATSARVHVGVVWFPSAPGR